MRRFLIFAEDVSPIERAAFACAILGWIAIAVMLLCACTHPPAATPALETRCK